tara:strand:+ start:506 stop:739 length:234 start_codon:yes stop_codon:yes gene_type:complete
MIIPIRCFTCGKILGNKWTYYKKELDKINPSKEDTVININSKTLQVTPEGKILDKLGLKRYCCRRIMLGHIDLIDII